MNFLKVMKTQVKPDSTIKLGGILFRYEKDHVSFDKTLTDNLKSKNSPL